MKPAKLGQHFLVNKNAAEKMVGIFLPTAGAILEIGPGKGILTDLLIKYRGKNKITAVELDDALYFNLKEKYKNEEDVEILNRDILEIDLASHFPGENEMVNVIGNVPYYISRELIDWLISHHNKIKKGMFMMQKEFVDKLMEKKGSKQSNARAILFNGLFQLEKMFNVQPGSFSPLPKVKSSVFLFERRVDGVFTSIKGGIDIDDFCLFLRQCFQNRRKTLFNNLNAVSFDMETLRKIFAKQRIDPKIRAEQLNLEDFLEIYRSC